MDILLAILSVVLVILILIQQRSAGMGAAFGGGSDGAVQRSRRGPEKALHTITIVVAIIFLAITFANAFLLN